MSRLRWPDSTNSVSEKPGTIHCGLMTLTKTGINPRAKGAEMSSVLRPVRKRKKGRTLPRPSQAHS